MHLGVTTNHKVPNFVACEVDCCDKLASHEERRIAQVFLLKRTQIIKALSKWFVWGSYRSKLLFSWVPCHLVFDSHGCHNVAGMVQEVRRLRICVYPHGTGQITNDVYRVCSFGVNDTLNYWKRIFQGRIGHAQRIIVVLFLLLQHHDGETSQGQANAGSCVDANQHGIVCFVGRYPHRDPNGFGVVLLLTMMIIQRDPFRRLLLYGQGQGLGNRKGTLRAIMSN